MIYKNDEQYKLTAEDVKLVRKKFPKFPVRLVYPDNRIRPSLSPHNTLPDKPNSISFPLRTLVKTPTGSDVWIYAENRIIDERGRYIYTPHNFVLKGTAIFQDVDIEIVWFLYTKCPYIEGGLNFQGQAKAVFEDLVTKAELKAEREALLADIKGFIYSSKIGLPETKLRKIAKAFFIPDVDELTFSQVKVLVEQEVLRRPDGVKKFYDMMNVEEFANIRASVQEAIDRKIIKYSAQKRLWTWMSAPGKPSETICEVAVNTDPMEALLEYYKGDASFAKNLDAHLKGKKFVLNKDFKPSEPDDGNDEEMSEN